VSTPSSAFSHQATPHWLSFNPIDASGTKTSSALTSGASGDTAPEGDLGAGELLFAVELVNLLPPSRSVFSPSTVGGAALISELTSPSNNGNDGKSTNAVSIPSPMPPAAITAVPLARRWVDVMVRERSEKCASMCVCDNRSCGFKREIVRE